MFSPRFDVIIGELIVFIPGFCLLHALRRDHGRLCVTTGVFFLVSVCHFCLKSTRGSAIKSRNSTRCSLGCIGYMLAL